MTLVQFLQLLFGVCGVFSPFVIGIAKYLSTRFAEQEKEIAAAQAALAEFKLEVAKQYVLKSDLDKAVADIKAALREGITDIKHDVERIEKTVDRQLDLFRREIS